MLYAGNNRFFPLTLPCLLVVLILVSHCFADSVVVFNEIMYHPATDQPGQEAKLEWVEFHNQMSYDMDISGWKVRGGIEFDFPEGAIIPRQGFLVLASSPVDLEAATGYAGAYGPFEGRLSNAGEEIRLYNNSGRLMEVVDYRDGGDWPVAPDGSGVSLAKIDPDAPSEPAENWTWSAQVGGTPGLYNFPSSSMPTSPIHVPTVPCEVEGEGLVAYFPLDEGSGSTVSDYSESSYTGTINDLGADTNWVAGKLGNALEFNPGSDDDDGWVEFPATVSFNGVSLACWVKNYGQTYYGRLCQFRTTGYCIELHDDRVYIWFAGTGDLGSTLTVPQDGNWHFVGVSVSDDTYTCCIDDQSESIGISSNMNFAISALQFGNLHIGDRKDRPFHGCIDEWRIFNRPLTLEELETIRDTGLFGSYRATNPVPGNGARVDPDLVQISWQLPEPRQGGETITCDVLFGTDETMTTANKIVGNRTVESTSVSVQPNEIYYWRVDCYDPNGAGPEIKSEGCIWTFGVQPWDLPDPCEPNLLALNEVTSAAVGPGAFWLEIVNYDDEALDLTGCTLTCAGSVTGQYVFGTQSLNPGHYLPLTEVTLGFRPADEDKLFLHNAGGNAVYDAVVVKNSHRGRWPDGEGTWLYPDRPTPGAANSFDFHNEIVINEITYHQRALSETPYHESSEEWIELYNRGDTVVDLTGWKLDEAVSYKFPSGTIIRPDEYLVVAKDANALVAMYPTINIVGDFEGSLSDKTDRIVLLDPNKNPADEVQYYDGGRWPSYADGYGASLELRDPWADNSKPEAWAASDEGSKTRWKTYTYSGVARASAVGPDGQWHELVLGLNDAGEVLLDDISVIEDPDHTPTQLIQNGSFESGTADKWRIVGNHRHSEVITDPDDPGNHVLHLVATGYTEHMHNHAETTLKDGENYVSISNGTKYEISFKGRWIGGSNQFNTRLYFNRLPRTTSIDVPALSGTPGARNSRYEENIGPAFSEFGHSPVLPDSDEPVTVSVVAEDPDGVNSCTLWWAVDGIGWNSEAMVHQGNGLYWATIPAQSPGTVVQFYVMAEDSLGATSTFPGAGAGSRALYQVDDGLADGNGLHNFRIVMTKTDYDWLHTYTNVMSNDRLGATVIYNRKKAYYDVGVRLKSGERGRPFAQWVGFNVAFGSDELFRGVHRTVAVERHKGLSIQGQREILTDQMINHAGGIISLYTDLIKVIAPRLEHTGAAQLFLARYGSDFWDSQLDDGGDGMVYEYEYIYYPTTTNDGTPEGLKNPQPDGISGTGIHDLGNDKENYRWNFLIKNNRRRDDFDGLIYFAKGFGLSGSAFHKQLGNIVDVDNWLRNCAFTTTAGTGDNYIGDNAGHNAMLYIRPDDQRAIYLPWDIDYSYAWNRGLVNNSDLSKIIENVGNKRLYYGHLYDILTTTYNQSYFTYWTNHFGTLMPPQAANFASYLTFINSRSNFLLGEIADRVAPKYDFKITDPNFTVDDDHAEINGVGWIDLKEIYVDGRPDQLRLSWTSTGSGNSTVFHWRATVPLDPGVNNLILLAYDFQGQFLASDTITVISTVTERPLQDYLRVTEVMYDPLGGKDYEFIELCNTGPNTLDLSNVLLSSGQEDIDFHFAGSIVTSLDPGEYVVVARDIAAFDSRYATGINVAGEYGGRGADIKNSGDQICLKGRWDAEILSFEYKDNRGWPLAADGPGHSLVPLDSAIAAQHNGSLNFGRNWRASTHIHGSPGEPDPAAPASIVLNEIMAHTDYSDPAHPNHDSNDWIELYNPTGSSITLSAHSWHLSDDKDELTKWAVPPTVIPANSWVSFDEVTGFHQDPLSESGFGLNKAGEEVLLSYLPGTAEGRVVDCLRFKGQEENISLGRYPDGGEYWYAMAPSRDLANTKPIEHIIISEIMYHPLPNEHEYIELHNPTSQPVTLWDSQTGEGWRFDGAVEYSFTSDTTIPASGYLLVVGFEPNAANIAEFESNYGPATVEIIGPYGNVLDNHGEKVALEKPQAPDDVGEDISWIIVDEAIYFDLSPWPSTADGSGKSLQRLLANLPGSDPANWTAATPSPGRLPSDFDGSGTVNLRDFSILSTAWLSEDSDFNWNRLCDLSDPPDSVINLQDLSVFSTQWLCSIPPGPN